MIGLFLAFYGHSCEIQYASLDNRHEFSQILLSWKKDELLYQNTRFVRMHLDSNDSHDSANANYFSIWSKPQTQIT